jgi:hypothetical protein
LENQIFVAHPWGALLGDGKVSQEGRKVDEPRKVNLLTAGLM